MGEIITFPAERVRPSLGSETRRDVQILFFTGVRYERDQGQQDAPPRRHKRRRKRA